MKMKRLITVKTSNEIGNAKIPSFGALRGDYGAHTLANGKNSKKLKRLKRLQIL